MILAGGASHRLPGPLPKPFLTLGLRPVYRWSLQSALELPEPIQTILVVPVSQVDRTARSLRDHGTRASGTQVVEGGTSRGDSVLAALGALLPSVEWVILHDAARPFASPALFGEVLRAAREVGAATAALTPTDALRFVTPPSVGPLYLPRETLVRVQTPQAFQRSLLESAHRQPSCEAPDDASLVSEAGHPVALVPGEPGNFKITSAQDWTLAQRLAATPEGPRHPRVGHGHDVHRLARGRPLFLAGVELPGTRGLVGHSDADVACHACADALLGAAGLGDLGTHFPPSEPAWRGAPGTLLLHRVSSLLDQHGWNIGNVDLTILAEAPQIAPHRQAMRETLAAALGIPTDRVSVKATTTEGLDAVGAGAGIAAHCVALILPKTH